MNLWHHSSLVTSLPESLSCCLDTAYNSSYHLFFSFSPFLSLFPLCLALQSYSFSYFIDFFFVETAPYCISKTRLWTQNLPHRSPRYFDYMLAPVHLVLIIHFTQKVCHCKESARNWGDCDIFISFASFMVVFYLFHVKWQVGNHEWVYHEWRSESAHSEKYCELE